MSQDIVKPTIENPFATQANTKNRAYKTQKEAVAKPVMKKILPLSETTEEAVVPEYQPGFYVSQASRRYVALKVVEKIVTADELPVIYDMAMILSNLFSRPAPSLSDVELAIQYHTIEFAQKVANGEEQLDLVRREAASLKIMPKAERIEFWKMVAVRLIEEYERLHPAKSVVNSKS